MRCTSCGSSCASSSCGHRRCSCRGRRRRPLQHFLVVLSTLSTSSCSCSCMSIKGSAVVCTGLPLWVRRESDAPLPVPSSPGEMPPAAGAVACWEPSASCARARSSSAASAAGRGATATSVACRMTISGSALNCVSLHGGGHSTASGQKNGPTCLVGPSRGEQADGRQRLAIVCLVPVGRRFACALGSAVFCMGTHWRSIGKGRRPFRLLVLVVVGRMLVRRSSLTIVNVPPSLPAQVVRGRVRFAACVLR